jgi:hypothetical protein
VTIQRVGLLDLTSMTERTNPVTSDPFTVTVVFWRRCWSYRQRLATFGSVVSNVCMLYQVTVRQTVARPIDHDPCTCGVVPHPVKSTLPIGLL